MATHNIEYYTHRPGVTTQEALWTEMLPGLWQGGTDDNDTIDVPAKTYGGRADITLEHFDAVVTLYAWARPVGWEVEELRWGFYDSEELPDKETLREAVTWAYRRWQAGKRVLLRCQMGYNRSGLITALVLMRHGLTADEAITLMRKLRSEWVLCNEDFEKAIRALETEVVTW